MIPQPLTAIPSFFCLTPSTVHPAVRARPPRVASLFAKGELGLNEPFVHESVIGTQFRARIVEPAMVGPYKGGIPEVSGSAYVTGLLKLVIDPADPLRHGFRLA